MRAIWTPTCGARRRRREEVRSAIPEADNGDRRRQSESGSGAGHVPAHGGAVRRRSRSPTRSSTKRRRGSKRRRRPTTWRGAKRAQLDSKLAQAEQEIRAAPIVRELRARSSAPFAGIVTAKIGRARQPRRARRSAADDRTRGRLPAGSLGRRIAACRAIRRGQPVAVTLDASTAHVEARVSEIVPAVDAASRTYTVKIDLPPLPGAPLGHVRPRVVSSSGSAVSLAIPAGGRGRSAANCNRSSWSKTASPVRA